MTSMKSHRLRNAVLTFAGVFITAVAVTRPAVYLWLAAASLQVIDEVNELRTHPLDRCFAVYPCSNNI